MKGKRVTEEKIIGILQEAQAGVPLDELTRRHGVSKASLHRWRAKYGGMQVSEARRLRELESENSKLKHIVAELTLDVAALKGVLSKKW